MFLIRSSALGIYSVKEGGNFQIISLLPFEIQCHQQGSKERGNRRARNLNLWQSPILLSSSQFLRCLSSTQPWRVVIPNLPSLWIRQKGSSSNRQVFKAQRYLCLCRCVRLHLCIHTSRCHHQSTCSCLFFPSLSSFPSRSLDFSSCPCPNCCSTSYLNLITTLGLLPALLDPP